MKHHQIVIQDLLGKLETLEVDEDVTNRIRNVVQKSQMDSSRLLKRVAEEIYEFRELLCVQDSVLEPTINHHASSAIDFDHLLAQSKSKVTKPPVDEDFEAAFNPSEMRCLALVSHNGMKKTMRQFVESNKNILKKFRLTGTNSTMTMLKEVFRNEPDGTVVFGPACASGPLGGDAELVAHLVNGKIGGIFFFQDPMDSHPHRADIDCLCRQVLVYNTMMADTPTSALMMLHCLRSALKGDGMPQLIPSFFFNLQSPTVEAYKKQQKSVVDAQKAQVVHTEN